MTAMQDSIMDQMVIWFSWAVFWGERRSVECGGWKVREKGAREEGRKEGRKEGRGDGLTCEDSVWVAFEGCVDVDVVEADCG